RRGRPQTYDSRVIGALRVAADASGWICGKRLAPGLADLVPALEREGALRIDDQVRVALLALSPATIDRRLAADKRTLKRRGLGTTKPGSLLKSQIPSVPRMWRQKMARERRDWQDNAVREMEEGVCAPWPSGINSAREGSQTTAR